MSRISYDVEYIKTIPKTRQESSRISKEARTVVIEFKNKIQRTATPEGILNNPEQSWTILELEPV